MIVTAGVAKKNICFPYTPTFGILQALVINLILISYLTVGTYEPTKKAFLLFLSDNFITF